MITGQRPSATDSMVGETMVDTRMCGTSNLLRSNLRNRKLAPALTAPIGTNVPDLPGPRRAKAAVRCQCSPTGSRAKPNPSTRTGCQVFRNGRSAGQFGALDDPRQSCHRSLTTGTRYGTTKTVFAPGHWHC